jgi:hypothetical protein
MGDGDDIFSSYGILHAFFALGSLFSLGLLEDADVWVSFSCDRWLVEYEK